ncbi:hypothetical protein [Micromonospora sp. KLBMP9576]|uniref:hypothetical protein n=1 Tax=Micromonospora sp. KLBMP9576 TaxID=3424769 RepID=UPI003D8F7569
MARRGWGGSIATAAGGAAGAGAAQLGFGYGLGIINWAPADPDAGSAAWVAGLIWATWIAATSTVLGAVCAQRLRDRGPAPHAGGAEAVPPDGPPRAAPAGTALVSVVLAVAAGLGALVTVLLVAVPAREAVADSGSPRDVAAGYAALGVLVGVLSAIWALRSRAAANNVMATVGWLWLLAVIAVVDGVLTGRGLTSAQLGIWQLGPDDGRYWIRDYFYWPGALLSLGSALVIGAVGARRDARHPDHRVGAAASGAAGPLLVATAYFLAVPRLSGISPEQVSAHLIAPYAVIIGIGGAVGVTALTQRAARRAASREPVRVPRQRTGAAAEHPADPAPGPHAHPADVLDAGTAAAPVDVPSAPAPPDGAAPDRHTDPAQSVAAGRRHTDPAQSAAPGRAGEAPDDGGPDGDAPDGDAPDGDAGAAGGATGESARPAADDPPRPSPTGRRPRSGGRNR